MLAHNRISATIHTGKSVYERTAPKQTFQDNTFHFCLYVVVMNESNRVDRIKTKNF